MAEKGKFRVYLYWKKKDKCAETVGYKIRILVFLGTRTVAESNSGKFLFFGGPPFALWKNIDCLLDNQIIFSYFVFLFTRTQFSPEGRMMFYIRYKRELHFDWLKVLCLFEFGKKNNPKLLYIE